MANTSENAIKLRNKRKRTNTLIAYSFIAPNFIGFAVFTLVPILMAVALSFMQWNGSGVQAPKFIGLNNYAKLFSDARFIKSFWNTIIYSVVTAPLTMVCALMLALVLNMKFKGRAFFRTITFFPYVASMVAVTAVWNYLFSPTLGPINQFLISIGIANPPGWATDTNWAMIDIIMFSVWKNMGYYMVMYLAGLQSLDPALTEAAEIDGAGKVKTFFHIVLPQLAPVTVLVTIMVTIQCFKVYDIILMITAGGPGTTTYVLVYYIYEVAFKNWNLGYASAISIVLFVMVLIVTIVQFKVQDRDAA